MQERRTIVKETRDSQSILMREESPRDSNAIAELTARAFAADKTWGDRRCIMESYIPSLVRTGAAFGRALSLVAEAEGGGLVGHALWYPFPARLRGQALDAWCLAPISVDPALWGRGIGSDLMRASLVALEERGASFAFLLGHDKYYPRFGFRTRMFGRVGIIPKPAPASPTPAAPRALRAPRPSDVPALGELFDGCFDGVDLALEPEPGFLPWMSWANGVRSVVLERDGKAAAYARYRPRRSPNAPIASAAGGEDAAAAFLLFLAADAEAAESLLAALGASGGQGAERPFIPLHPASPSAASLFPGGYESVSELFDAAMAMPLRGGPEEKRKAAEEYCRLMALPPGSGGIVPGLPLFPSIFDMDDMNG
jgi:putative acetyltransferase